MQPHVVYSCSYQSVVPRKSPDVWITDVDADERASHHRDLGTAGSWYTVELHSRARLGRGTKTHCKTDHLLEETIAI